METDFFKATVAQLSMNNTYTPPFFLSCFSMGFLQHSSLPFNHVGDKRSSDRADEVEETVQQGCLRSHQQDPHHPRGGTGRNGDLEGKAIEKLVTYHLRGKNANAEGKLKSCVSTPFMAMQKVSPAAQHIVARFVSLSSVNTEEESPAMGIRTM